MTDPIIPARPVNALRRLMRRIGGTELARIAESADQGATPNLPAVIVTPVTEQPDPVDVTGAAYAAQVMGQGGQKRGLRGGAEILDRARSTYLETEYSGPADRRIRRGRIAKTEI